MRKKNNIILWGKKYECTGCAACFAACAQGAIELKEDKEGFLYPYIDTNKCIKCKKCIKVCPAKSYNLKDSKMEIMYYPFDNNLNKYISISQEILNECGCTIVPMCSFRESFKVKCNAVILNWYDSIDVKCSKKLLIREMFFKVLKLYVLKMRGVKIINTFHNKIQHNLDAKWKRGAHIYTSLIMWISDYVIILSKSSERYLRPVMGCGQLIKKVRYIPHPNYLGAYPNDKSGVISRDSDNFRILFVGQIRRYKNIEVIIECAKRILNKNIEFNIYGLCLDSEYKSEILSLIEGVRNINIHFEFVPDDKICKLMQENDVVVLPYDSRSSMNSGTVILAFSNSIPVICPNICTIDEYEIAKKYTYEYKSHEEHVNIITEKVLLAYTEWDADKNEYYQFGELLKKEVEEKNSREILIGLYKNLIQEIKK